MYKWRVIQIGLKISDLDDFTYGEILDLFTEQANDNCEYRQVAGQDDFDKF